MPDVRAHRAGSLFLRKRDGHWVASVTINGKRPTHGCRHVHKPTEKRACDEAKALLAELLRLRDAGAARADPRLSLTEFLQRWLVDVRPNLAPATWRKHESIIRCHIAPLLGARQLASLTVSDVRGFLEQTIHARPRRVDRGQRVPLLGQTRRHHRATLRRALSDALRDGLVTRNVAALAEAPKLTRRERPFLTAEQARTLIEGTRDDRLGPLFHLAVTTGMREAEILGLAWKDVDLGSEHLAVGMSGSDDRLIGSAGVANQRPVARKDRNSLIQGAGQPSQSGAFGANGDTDTDRTFATGPTPADTIAHARSCRAGVSRAAPSAKDSDYGVGPEARTPFTTAGGATPSVHVRHTLHRDWARHTRTGELLLDKDGEPYREWVLADPKTPKSRRTIPLTAGCVSALREHRKRQLEERVGAGGKYPAFGLVFTTRTGWPMYAWHVLERLYKAQERLGLPRVGLHGLRHSTATILYAAGVDIETIADVLGHSSSRVTSQLYRHRVDELQRDAAEKMGRAVG